MTLARGDDTAKITYDRAIWNELCSLRFVAAGHNAVTWDRSGSARPSSPASSAMPPSGGASACTSNAATASNASRQPGWTTTTTTRSANCCASTCSPPTTSPCRRGLGRHRRHLRTHRRAPPRRSDGRALEPRASQSAQVQQNACEVVADAHTFASSSRPASTWSAR